mgnify:CR=1 FL=1
MTQERATKAHDPLQAIRYQVADAVGGLMELWGFKRIMGRTWTLLYLADAPLSAADLGDALQVSPGSVSMTVSELLKWGVVKKTWVPGDRRDFYLPETSVWKMVSRVIRERELLYVRETNDRLTAAQGLLSELQASTPPDAPREGGEGHAGAASEPPSSTPGQPGASGHPSTAGQPGVSGQPGASGHPSTAGQPSSAALHTLASRITALQQLSQVGQLLIEQALSGRTIDVVALQAALNLVAPAEPHATGDAAPAAESGPAPSK